MKSWREKMQIWAAAAAFAEAGEWQKAKEIMKEIDKGKLRKRKRRTERRDQRPRLYKT